MVLRNAYQKLCDLIAGSGSSDRLATVSEKCIHSVAWPNLSPDPTMQGDRGKPTDCFSWIWGQATNYVDITDLFWWRGIFHNSLARKDIMKKEKSYKHQAGGWAHELQAASLTARLGYSRMNLSMTILIDKILA